MSDSSELVARYDPAGAVVGAVPRGVMRRRGLWHAATAVLVLSPDRKSVYVHRRTDTKDIYPGAHDCWAGGVVAAGEVPRVAAERELAEELGITGAVLVALPPTTYESGSVRFHAFRYETTWDGPIAHQPSEIAAGGWMSLEELRSRLDDPEWPFVPDGRQFFQHWWSMPGQR